MGSWGAEYTGYRHGSGDGDVGNTLNGIENRLFLLESEASEATLIPLLAPAIGIVVFS